MAAYLHRKPSELPLMSMHHKPRAQAQKDAGPMRPYDAPCFRAPLAYENWNNIFYVMNLTRGFDGSILLSAQTFVQRKQVYLWSTTATKQELHVRIPF
jgi:hypothetical protein